MEPTSEQNFPMASEINENVVVARPSGRLDNNSAEPFLDAATKLMEHCNSVTPLVLDFSAVEYISSAGLRALTIISRKIKAKSGRLAIVGLQPMVTEILHIAGFHKVIPCFDTVEEALKEQS